MQIDPRTIDASSRYKLMIGGIVPRPIALVSTVSPGPEAMVNVAPFSFFAGVGSDPMTLLFCPANTAGGGEKDTLRNAKPVSEGGSGEFVVHICPDRIARQMAACAEPLAYGQSEAAMAGLTLTASAVVRPMRVVESPLAFECVTKQVIRTNPGVPSGGNIVIGEVVSIYADDGLINERYHIDPALLDAIGRMGGLGYCRTRERFEMAMGRGAMQT
jgi:flavin reductase (DIM6/NTAB) family NADH-FMN oxidoreductase RutF